MKKYYAHNLKLQGWSFNGNLLLDEKQRENIGKIA